MRYEPTRAGRTSTSPSATPGTREFSEGFDSRDTNEIADVSDEPYVRAGVELRF